MKKDDKKIDVTAFVIEMSIFETIGGKAENIIEAVWKYTLWFTRKEID